MVFRRFTAAIACVALLLVATQSQAQTTTGGLTGVVRDSGGGGVPGATVKATNTATNAEFTTVSSDTGQYVLRGLPVGPYALTVELTGFQNFKATDITVRVNEEVRLDAVLTVGAVSETITISGLASTVDTSSSTLKTVVDQQRIESLPLNGRNPTALLLTLSSVQTDTRTSLTSGQTYPGVTPVSSNGARGNTANFILDGGSNNDHYNNAPNPMPNPDALQEFSVQTNNFSAEYGRNVGAIVNAVTRSGTNQLHGLAFGYLRDHNLNATNFFTPGKDDGLKRKQYGGTLGGAIRQNRTFFFGSYQGTNEKRRPNDSTTLVPTAAERKGDFSALTRVLRNPFTGQNFTNNQIPAALLDPTALKILNEWIPLPNPGAGDNPHLLRYAVPQKLDDHQYLTRVDHRLSDQHQVYGRLWISRAEVPAVLEPGNALITSTGRKWQNTIVSINDNYTISSRMLNNLVLTFNRTSNQNFQSYPPDYSSLGIQNVYNDATPQWVFGVSGYFNVNTGDTNDFFRQEFQLVDTVRWTTARHELAVGVDYSYGQGDIVNNFRANGRYTFNGSAPFTGDALADFLVGKFQQFEQGIGEYKNTRMHFFSTFVQDTWRVNNKLTLNLGLRWDPFIPYTDVNNRLGVYRPGQQSTVYVNAPLGAVYPEDAGVPRGGYEATWSNLGPRIGVAYDPFGDGKSSIRAGYGMFYDRPNTIATNSPANQGPFGTVVRFPGDATNSLRNPYLGRVNPFPADPFGVPSDVQFVFPHTMFSYADSMTNGRLQSWHVTLEREIVPTWLVRVAYAGSKGDRLVTGRELNPAIYAVGATTSTTDQRRALFPAFGSITSIEAEGRSSYHSMQLTLDKRMAKGFSLLSSYTLSKTLDDTSENKQTAATATNPFDLSFDYGPANFDRRHRWVSSLLWEIPGTLPNRVLDAALGDWSVTGIVTLQSGLPINVTSGVDNARTGTGGQRADQVGDPLLPSDRARDELIRQWFNTAAFTTNALGTFGNVGRNSLRGPGYANVDLGVHKTFPVASSVKLQFRFEVFNALNRVNLDLPNSDRSSGNFGRILSAQDPRILQFALRASF